jgi:hypothetical protein
MSNSLRVNSFKTDLLKETGYESWLNFWLNQERYIVDDEKYTYGHLKNDKYEWIHLPFSITILEWLVVEEFKTILEHLGCKTFDDFDQLVKRRGGFYDDITEPVNLIFRAVNGSIYLRQYVISVHSLNKLKLLSEKGHKYRSYQEKIVR